MVIIKQRIEEFKIGDKDVVFIDFSGFNNDKEAIAFIEASKPLIKKYPYNSIYTITNIEDVALSANSHDIISGWVEHNKPYVKFGVVYGVDGIKKVLGKTLKIVTGRKNLVYLSSKEEAIEYLTNLE
ncbi:MAG: hypothetical protein FWD44_01440 [Oscillospiraceae bacterium]|nr:hypothetical protein [Oscillospiraceae bacterium]